MAALTKHPNSPFWTAIFYDGAGHKVRRSTKQRDRRMAMKVAIEWEELAKAGRERRLTEAQTRKVCAEILERATGESLHFYSCADWLTEWLAGKRGAVSAKSMMKYEQVCSLFLKHLGERAKLTLAAIGPKDVRAFRDSLSKGGRVPSTVNQLIHKVLSVPFLQAVRVGYIPTNPCTTVELLRDEQDGNREVFSIEQVTALIHAAQGDWKGAILAAFYTGLRLRDIAEMRWEMLDLKAGFVRIKTRKTGEILMLPIHPELSNWIQSQRRGIGKAPVFPELAGKGTGGRHGLSGRFKAIMESAGIKGQILRTGGGDAGRQTSSLSFHSLRHSFVSALANAGVSSELRQKLSGHADERSHANYTHHELTTLQKAISKLPNIAS